MGRYESDPPRRPAHEGPARLPLHRVELLPARAPGPGGEGARLYQHFPEPPLRPSNPAERTVTERYINRLQQAQVDLTPWPRFQDWTARAVARPPFDRAVVSFQL